VTVLSIHTHTLLDLRENSVLPEVQRNEKLLSNAPVTRRECPTFHLINCQFVCRCHETLDNKISPSVCRSPSARWFRKTPLHSRVFASSQATLANPRSLCIGIVNSLAWSGPCLTCRCLRRRRVHGVLSSWTMRRRTMTIRRIHRAPDVALEACLAVSPAHLHVNLLPEVQRRGWGRRLIGRAVEHLREQRIDAVWLGLDERNAGARKFYERIGFREIPGAPSLSDGA